MKIEKQIQDDHQAKLIVEIEQEKMDASKHRAARKLAERGKIPGFRPGKAPYPVIVRYYGDQAITEQAIDDLVEEMYPKILEEADIKPAAPGSLESVDNLEPPKLTFRVPLAPEVDLGDYLAIRKPYEWTAPDKKEVDQALEDLRQMYASTENVERPIQIGDYILADVKGERADPKEGDEDRAAALSRTGFAAFVRENDREDEWPFSGFAKELVGLKAGDSKIVIHTYADDDSDESLRGQTINFAVTVKTVRGVILPDLDDDFAKQTGAGDTVDKLMETIQKDVEARSKASYDDKYFEELIDKIKEGATIKYAQHSLDHEGEHVLEDLQQRLAQQGLDLPTYFKMRNTTQEKFVEDEVKPVAKKRLERSLILDELIRKEKIEVDNTSLDAEFNNTLSELQMQGVNFGQIRGGKQGQQRVAEAVAMESASRLLTRRALDTLKAIAIGEHKAPESTEAGTPSEETTAEAPAEVVEAAAPVGESAEADAEVKAKPRKKAAAKKSSKSGTSTAKKTTRSKKSE
ncbi:MAG TPA: trigger factor [Anaerolineales bacterium]|nr:trigger factor [Anaerolineales bacterium]